MPDYDIRNLSVRELFVGGRYIIPVYQRNYAWTPAEVQQLVVDIRDCALGSAGRSYYLGSLVVFDRDEDVFETVDGQQRHTTLGILLAVLKNEFKQAITGIDSINLEFDSRKVSSATLRRLFDKRRPAPGAVDENAMLVAYRECTRVLRQQSPEDIRKITHYLLHQVKLIRTPVPAETDLNHYFEVMNNRGEQLDKHEVLKARLLEQLHESDQAAFAAIWDACADMGRYVQLSFPKKLRAELFGKDWNTCPDKLAHVAAVLKSSTRRHEESMSLAEIMSKPPGKLARDEAPEEANDIGGVVTFANFLLQVLRIRGAKPRDVPLDDKRLLETFEQDDFAPDPAEFIIDLLRCRMLLDRYVIRRQANGGWGIMTLTFKAGAAGKDSVYLVDTFDSYKNQQLVMLLAMFHVSFPTQIYKHWLSAALRFLYKSEKEGIDGQTYLERMEEISDRFMFGRFCAGEPVNYYNLCFTRAPETAQTIDEAHLHLGTSVQNFIFNRLDYLLWRELRDGASFAGVDMAAVMAGYRKFAFTLRSSVEHHYPQHPEGRHLKLEQRPQMPHGCDTFGNLCLISRSNNSKLNNLIPDAKKGHFSESTAVESLKQVFMFTYIEWGPKNEAAIRHHEKMMIDMLCTRAAQNAAPRPATGARRLRSA